MLNPSAYALLGHPVNHSPSPALHNAWMTHYGIEGRYEAIDFASTTETLEALLRGGSYTGVNLTTPLKERLIGRLDTVTEEAQIAGAVNTVVHRDGDLHGFNTDIQGFLDAIRPAWRAPWDETDVLILGAGGAARAVAVAAGSEGARAVRVLNRTVDRARRLVTDLGGAFPATRWVDAPDLDALSGQVASDHVLVVDATSGARSPWARPSLLSWLGPGHLWMDLTYWRDLSGWAELCEARGVAWIDGTEMLIHQAAHAFQHFTGVAPDVAIARRVLDELQSIQDSLD